MSDKEKLRQFYLDILDKDYKVSVDDDGDVQIKHPDMGYMFISLYEDDPEYFFLGYPNFYDSKMAQEEFGASVPQLFRIINEVNRTCKAIKTALIWNKREQYWDVWISIEAFVAATDTMPTREQITQSLRRNISAIRSGRQRLFELLRKHKEENGLTPTPNDQGVGGGTLH